MVTMGIRKNDSGQIAVFMAIVFLSVIILIGIVIDLSRIITAESHIRKSVENAARSALALFNSRLKEDYGLFAIGKPGGNGLEEEVRHYINMNLSSGEEGLDFYGFRLENVKVTPLFNLTDNETVKRQILEYMKYRVPESAVEGVLKNIGLLKEAGKMSQIYERKTSIDETLGELEDIQQSLKTNISGIGEFNRDGTRDSLISEYAGLINEMKEYIIGNLKEESKRDDDDEGYYKEDDGDNDEENNGITYNVYALKEKIREIYHELAEKHTEAYMELNGRAAENAYKLLELSSAVRNAINELRNHVNENYINYINDTNNRDNMENDGKEWEGPNSYYRDFLNTLLQELDEMMILIPDEEDIKEMAEIFENNIMYLEECLISLKDIQSRIERDDISVLTENEIVEKLCKISSLYEKIHYNHNAGNDSNNYNDNNDYGMTPPESWVVDPRDVVKEIAARILRKDGEKGPDMVDAGIDTNELPSRKKVMDGQFEENDEAEYKGKLEELEKEIDFIDKTAGFSKRAMDFITSIGSVFSKSFDKMRDKVYLIEYVTRTFKNQLNAEKNQLNAGTVERQSFYNAEVEYILNGDTSEDINILKTRGQILLIRFGLNTLHVYSDAEKRQQAYAIATALAGWWTGGAGIPIISNLIMCAWGMGEAILDLQDLVSGKAVALYKTREDWKLDLDAESLELIRKKGEGSEGSKEGSNSTGSNSESGRNKEGLFDLKYDDYLKILLVLKNTEEILGRIQDLVEINTAKSRSGFKMGNAYAGIRIEAEVSMKYLFLTRSFMPRQMQTPDGRHVFRVVVYEEY